MFTFTLMAVQVQQADKFIHDTMYTLRYSTINAGGYAHVKYEKETGYRDSSYVTQFRLPPSKRWLHGPPQVCYQMAFYWLIHFAGFHSHDQQIYAGTAHIYHCVQLCGNAS